MPSRSDKELQEVPVRRLHDYTPWWVTAIYKFGVPTAFAAFLLWTLVSRIDSSLNDVKTMLGQHQADMSYAIMQAEKTGRVLQQICVNGALEAGRPPAVCLE